MKLYNSFSKNIEIFKPLKNKKVLMYVCGITPYDTTHLGHAFLYVFFDAVFRILNYKGFEVNYTQNVTDIDDSILEKAREVNQNWMQLGDFWTKRFLKDLDDLNVIRPTYFVKATDSINKIVKIVKLLKKSGFAYEVNGNVYFEVKKFPKYGQLAGFTRKQMLVIASERGTDIKDPSKKDPLDFILWQRSKAEEPSWDSPWGKGRPGWHIECSAMVHQYLGDQIDIHGGGRDLIFPHHESEIAQSKSYTKKTPFAKYWMHCSMLMYQGEKMSKSLGNLIMVKNLLKKYPPNSIRWILLSHHYRIPFEFNYNELEEASKNTLKIEKLIRKLKVPINFKNNKTKRFDSLIEQDFNFPEALNFLLTLTNTKDINSLAYLYKTLGFNF